MKIHIEIDTPLMLIKHAEEGSSVAYHTFELWYIPDDAQELYDRACVASELCQTFEGDFEAARSECQQVLDRLFPLARTLWIEKTDEVFVLGKEEHDHPQFWTRKRSATGSGDG